MIIGFIEQMLSSPIVENPYAKQAFAPSVAKPLPPLVTMIQSVKEEIKVCVD